VNATLNNFNLNGISTANLTQVNVAVDTLGCLGQMISQFAANGSQAMDPVLRNYTALINQGVAYINSGGCPAAMQLLHGPLRLCSVMQHSEQHRILTYHWPPCLAQASL
jgi:hypothetical protein